ncbi:carbohydrate ABC transporter permease [Microbacterium imperiale]|uniref:Sugar ABC transporter permease n=1 Tax=Microbacterium imperiale TaxID=33884 RepID=A0A9W6HIB5_9MICO|nr:carbohydrate ABC transporter permease [Microbacterium imperiale]MBP2421075.1 ABC-type glycerol-3-phosphate transport system permease component [Microbacterium imperiale]MDS0199811.1 carbohydrate ABC transporter permease [Microbacterium imperiale]BFE41416.1 carbohydrate ABC transporter permease [Microbacterium imperiale]GLJ80367.1 sugar ABC transporter permease [Microbacterium imperiale]
MTVIQSRPAASVPPVLVARRRRLHPVDLAQRVIGYVLIVLLALFCLVPFAWVVFSSVDANAGATVQLPTFSFENFVRFFTAPGTPLLLMNSLIIAIASTALNLVLGIAGGYALSRFSFRGRRFFMFSILLIRVIPAPATIVALYLIMVNLGLANTLHGLIIVQAVSGLPVTLWLMKGTIDAVPIELEEAAWTDGNTRLQAARRIVLPLIGPGLGAAAMLMFMGSWGDFLTPLVLLQNQDLYPLAIGLFRAFSERNVVDWGLLAASAVVYVLPPAVLYMLVRKNLLKSSLGGALKG